MNFTKKISWIFIAFIFALCISFFIYFVFVKTPSFLFDIKNKTIENEKLMALIGGEQGWHLYYPDSSDENKTFFVKVYGVCEGSSITINGFYDSDGYSIKDTVIIIGLTHMQVAALE